MDTKLTDKNHIAIKIKAHIFHFITPSMILSCIGLFWIIFALRETVTTSFLTNVPLNSTIIAVIFVAIIIAFINNLKLYNAIVFLKNIEVMEESDEITADDVNSLALKLEKEGQMLNIQNMYTALENLANYGSLNFTDNDARLIKSKLGGRMRTSRGVVNYFAGILVMLGLIGTFWGLLQTITSVGAAMGAVSASFSASAEDGGGADIGSFIASISEPLQGMGVAFSSSLFGLSGSLFLGFLNFFAGRAQNDAIETVSRWIDNRLVGLNPNLKKKVDKHNVPGANDLKSWLASFVYLSNKTNQKMGQIMLALTRTTDVMMQSTAQSEKLHDTQKDISAAFDKLSQRLSYIQDSVQYLSRHVDPAMDRQSDIADHLNTLKLSLDEQHRISTGLATVQHSILKETLDEHYERNAERSTSQMDNLQKTLIEQHRTNTELLTTQTSTLKRALDEQRTSNVDLSTTQTNSLQKTLDEQHAANKQHISAQRIQMNELNDQLRHLNSHLQIMPDTQNRLIMEVGKLMEKEQNQDERDLSAFSNLVWQLNTILEEIKQNNVSSYMDIFKDFEDKPASPPSSPGDTPETENHS